MLMDDTIESGAIDNRENIENEFEKMGVKITLETKELK